MTMANVPLAPTVAVATPVSAVSWQAVIAGAFAAAAITLILIALGSGFGLSIVSPWPRAGASIASFGVITAIWLVIVQWISSAAGGYLAGRMRVRWVGLHTNEVTFRDTAHGLLTWAVATVVGAILLASAAGSLVGGGVQATATLGGGAAKGATQAAATNAPTAAQSRDYAVDGLFRASDPAKATATADNRSEAGRILAMSAANGQMAPADRTYLAQLVAARTGLSAEDAQKRVDATIAQVKAAEDKAREAADKARKAASTAAIFLAVSMLIGAFIASAAAALGGLRRDEHA